MAELAIWSIHKTTRADWLPSRAIRFSHKLEISELIWKQTKQIQGRSTKDLQLQTTKKVAKYCTKTSGKYFPVQTEQTKLIRIITDAD